MSEQNNDIRVQLATMFTEHNYNKRYERLSVVYYMVDGKIEFYQAIKDVPRKTAITDKDYWNLATISVNQDDYNPGDDNPSDDNSAIEILNMDMGDMILPMYNSTSNQTQIMLYAIVHDVTSPVIIDKVKINNVSYNAILDDSTDITENDCYVYFDNISISNEFLEESRMTLEDISLMLGTEVNIGDMLLMMQISLLQTYSGTITFELITNYGNAIANISGYEESINYSVYISNSSDYSYYISSNTQYIQYKINDGDWTSADNNTTIFITPIGSGTIYARGIDGEGRVLAETQYNYSYGFELLKVSVTSSPSSGVEFTPRITKTYNLNYKLKIDNGEYEDLAAFSINDTSLHTITLKAFNNSDNTFVFELQKTIKLTGAVDPYLTLTGDPGTTIDIRWISYSENNIDWYEWDDTVTGTIQVQIPSNRTLYLRAYSDYNDKEVNCSTNSNVSIRGCLDAFYFPEYIIDTSYTTIAYEVVAPSIYFIRYINCEYLVPATLGQHMINTFSGNFSTIRYNNILPRECSHIFYYSALEYPPAISTDGDLQGAFRLAPLKEFPIINVVPAQPTDGYAPSLEYMLMETPLVVSNDGGQTISFGTDNDNNISYPISIGYKTINSQKEFAMYLGCVTGMGILYRVFSRLDDVWCEPNNSDFLYADLNSQISLKDQDVIPQTGTFDRWDISILGYNTNNKWDYSNPEYLSNNVDFVYNNNNPSNAYIWFRGYWFTSAGLKPRVILIPHNNIDEYKLYCDAVRSTIYYTTDGTTPTTNSQVYTTPIQYQSGLTIKAIAVLDNLVSEMFTLSL